MGIGKYIVNNLNSFTTTNDALTKTEFEKYTLETDMEICKLISSVRELERNNKVEKRRRWRNALKYRRRYF